MDHSLSYFLYTSSQVKQGEANAAKLAGISMYQLMQRAGFSIYQLFTRYYSYANRVLVVCGSGNNGGDGYVFASLCKQAGYDVTVVSTCDTGKLSGDAGTAYREWISNGGKTLEVNSLAHALTECEVIVDGILGTGLSGEVRANISAVIGTINDAAKPVIAIDIPSGLCSDTGRVLGCAIEAQQTMTFIGIKQGLVTGKARDVTGRLHFAGLEVSSQFDSLQSSVKQTLVLEDLLLALPKRQMTSHKGDHGRLLCIGGNQGYSGAIKLCFVAAARTGTGLISCLCHSSSILSVQMSTPEVMSLGADVADTSAVDAKFNSADVIAIGPGLGMDSWANTLYQRAVVCEKAKVFDADALNLLAKIPNIDERRVITPHPGEAARLLGCTIAEVENDRYDAVLALQKRYGGVVLLKGAGTLICDGEKTYVCLAGNPGMATGGMGDVLTGIIAALIAQGVPLSLAARLGACLHSGAADMEVHDHGQLGLLASDIIPRVRQLLNRKV